MKFMKRTLSLALALVMMFSMLAVLGTNNVSAIAGGGLPTGTPTHIVGVDLSKWNEGIDAAAMKADGCEFVMLRLGYQYSGDELDHIDAKFFEFYEAFRAVDMPLGAYFYSRATTVAGARQDAEWLIKTIEDNNLYFEYPIYYDVEESFQVDDLPASTIEAMCLEWCETLEENGYFPGIYMTVNNINSLLSSDFKAKYDTWGAKILKNAETTTDRYYSGSVDYSGQVGMWQFTFQGQDIFAGVDDTKLDANVSYKDYDAITKKYGYNNRPDATPSTPSTNGSLVAGKTPTFTGSVSLTGTGLTDGIYSTDVDDGTWLALNSDNNASGTGYAHFDYDLGAKYTLTDAKIHVAVKSEYGIGRPYEMQIEVSDDNSTWIPAGTFPVPSGTWADGTYTFTISDFGGAAGRYVRIKAVTGGWWYINEIVVNGTPYVAPSTPSGSNGSLVAGKTPTFTGSVSLTGTGLTDGVYSTDVTDGTWLALNSDNNASGTGYAHFDYDLGAKYTLTDAKIHVGVNSTYGIGRPYDIQIEVSDDNSTWTQAGAFSVPAGGWADGTYTFSINSLDGAGRYVRVKAVTAGWWYVNEIVINGVAYVPPAETKNESLAGNATVIIADPADALYSASLNDGQAAGIYNIYTEGAWYGFRNGVNTDEDGYAEIIFDLGASYDLSKVRLHLANNAAAGICNPWGVTVAVADSIDGPYTDYPIEFGVLETTDGTDTANTNNKKAYWSEMPDITGLTGRYVKIYFWVGGSWMFINEVEIFGTESADKGLRGDVDADGEITASDYLYLKRIYFGTLKMSALEDPDNAKYRCDVEVNDLIEAMDYILLKRAYFGTYKIVQD